MKSILFVKIEQDLTISKNDKQIYLFIYFIFLLWAIKAELLSLFIIFSHRKAKKLFEKYCEPLLHLAGFAVTIIQTQSENHARNIMANLNTHNDVIVVAGGDGTLSDVVTGLMRRYQKTTSFNKRTPVGILPLGQNNRVANSLFYGYEELFQVRQLAEATMAVVRGRTKPVDVVEVELLEVNILLSIPQT